MPADSPEVPKALALFLTIFLIAVLAAFYWAGRQVLFGRPVLPESNKGPNRVRWGMGTMLFVLLFPQVLGVVVRGLYEVTRSDSVVIVNARDRSVPSEPQRGRATTPKQISYTEVMALNAVLSILILTSVPPLIGVATGVRLDDFGLTLNGAWRDLRIGSTAFLIVTPMAQLVFILAVKVFPSRKHPLEEMLRSVDLDWKVILLAYVTSMIFAPVIEELIFRGLIQGWLSRLYYERKTSTLRDDAHEKFVTIGIPRPSRGLAPLAAVARTSVFIPILITSLFFAAVHYPQMPAPFAIFVLSLGLGLLYERTRRLLPSIILHSLFNGFNTTVMVLQLLSDPHMDARVKSEPKTPPVVRIRDENGGLSLARDALAVRFPEAEGQGWSCNSLAIAV